ncbi:MAG: carboxypeptidase-like regulatory domain-containing protein [Planctomycetaceae bacterium]|jgi:hypothetical protein|nr:carboxypeptidase-like regulatory domain-containing protein [Planctomycetaceae bacterium]
MKQSFLILIFSCLFFATVGCGKQTNMPKLVPCHITVTDNGVPVAGARISMADESSAESLAINGITDSFGVAKMRTTYTKYTASGVPQGTFKVAIDKEPPNLPPQNVTDDMNEQQADAAMKKWEEEVDQLRIIPKNLIFISTTPITLEIKEKSNLNIDIADYKK